MENNSIIAFDLDDTLYKERDFVMSGRRAVAQHIAASNPGQANAESIFQVMCNSDDAFDAALELQLRMSFDCIINIDEMLNVYRHHMPAISLSNDTRRTLTELIARGYTLAIITDGRDYTQRNKINALRLPELVSPEAIIISEEIGNDKNSPLPFDTLMARLGNDSKYIYVGDNPSKDFHYPNLMGWTTYMLADINSVNIHKQDLSKYAPEFHPQHIITDISQLLTI